MKASPMGMALIVGRSVRRSQLPDALDDQPPSQAVALNPSRAAASASCRWVVSPIRVVVLFVV